MTGATRPPGQSSSLAVGFGVVAAAVVAPTAVLVAAAVLVTAASTSGAAKLAEIPPGAELPEGGVALSISDDTLHDDLQILGLCEITGDEAVRFLAKGRDIELLVDVGRRDATFEVSGGESRDGEAATVAIGDDRDVSMEGEITRSGSRDLVRFILTANCDIDPERALEGGFGLDEAE